MKVSRKLGFSLVSGGGLGVDRLCAVAGAGGAGDSGRAGATGGGGDGYADRAERCNDHYHADQCGVVG